MARAPAPSSILGRLLSAAGYRLGVRNGMTVAIRSGDHRAVVIAPFSRSPTDVERLFPGDAVHRTVVYDNEPGPAARASAAQLGIEIVDPSTLGPALGELLLPSALDVSAPSSPEADLADLDDPFPVFRGERIVRPRIGRTEAVSLVGIDGPRYTLRLVPHYVAAYRVRSATADGGVGPVHHRLVAVNATTRRAEIWEEGVRELVHEIDEPHQRLAPQLSESLAQPIAVDLVRREHTVRVDHTEQLGGALVIESRRVPPAIDDVRLSPFVLLYVPFWYAEGSGGRVVLDAVTGDRRSVSELSAVE
jgi:hypothetical protein